MEEENTKTSGMKEQETCHQQVHNGEEIIEESTEIVVENMEANGQEENSNENEEHTEANVEERVRDEAEKIFDKELETETVWNENRCVVCNVPMEVDDPGNRTEKNTKLKKFFFEYLAVSKNFDILPDDDPTFPFCAGCAQDLGNLMSYSCKIEFMNLHFDHLRDKMARKTVNTYLHRTRPDLMNERPEPLHDDDNVKDDEPSVEPTNSPKPSYNLNDLLFTQWKQQYDVIIPGRYKTYPTFMKAVDSKQKINYNRVDPSGKHHFKFAINSDSTEAIKMIPSESPAATKVISQGVQGLQEGVDRLGLHQGDLRGLKRKPVPKINGDASKRVRTCQDEDSSVESCNGEMIQPSSSATGEKMMYKCPLCPKTFTTKYSLTAHSRKHSGEFHVCEVCEKGFISSSYLKVHMRTHTGERPFKCNVPRCGKTFTQRTGLATHALVHTGEKPYVCDHAACGKAFRQRYHLTQHQLIHSGVQPYECEICGSKFNVKMNLREHIRRHFGDRPYHCTYCVCQGFFRKKILRDHIVKAHPESQMPPELAQLGPTKKCTKAKVTNNELQV